MDDILTPDTKPEDLRVVDQPDARVVSIQPSPREANEYIIKFDSETVFSPGKIEPNTLGWTYTADGKWFGHDQYVLRAVLRRREAFEVGDRVRYNTKQTDNRVFSPGLAGLVGTVTKVGQGDWAGIEVVFDETDRTESLIAVNLTRIENESEIPMSKTIDTTKPLRLLNDGRKVTFITETSENHILVSIAEAFSNWTIFNNEGKFVRSQDGGGVALVLANVIEDVVHRRSLSVGGKSVVVNVTTHDGVVTNVEWVK